MNFDKFKQVCKQKYNQDVEHVPSTESLIMFPSISFCYPEANIVNSIRSCLSIGFI